MDLRNVQKTGNMFYIYLPTTWCKRYGITGKSKVSIEQNNDGSLVVYPKIIEQKKQHLTIDLSSLKASLDPEILNKFIVAAYINPADSFVITLPHEVDLMEVFDQKKLLNIEFVDFDRQHISCESPLQIEDPYVLLKTMIKKIKGMFYVMLHKYHKGLIEKYEDEIDKSKLLIEKAVVSAMIHHTPSQLRPIELHYVAIIAKELERMVDHAKELDKKENAFLGRINTFIEQLQELLEHIEQRTLRYDVVVELFSKEKKHTFNRARIADYHKIRILSSLRLISETLLDWLVTSQLLDEPKIDKETKEYKHL